MYSIKGIAILDNDGNRILAKYYDDTFASIKEQKAYEKNLFTKTHKANCGCKALAFESLKPYSLQRRSSSSMASSASTDPMSTCTFM